MSAQMVSGLSLEEAKAKKAEEEAKRAEAEREAKRQAEAKTGDEEEEAEETVAKKKKTAAEEDDIDEDEQLQYAAAAQLQNGGKEDDDGSEEDPSGQHRAKKQRRHESLPSQHKRISLGTPRRAKKAKTHTMDEAKRAPTPSGPSITSTVHTVASEATRPAAGGSTTRAARPSWNRIRMIKDFGFSGETCGDLFAKPSALTTESQQAKWVSEAVKQKPWLVIIEKVLLGEKVTDQQFKSAVTAAKKVTTKVDKKLEYENEANREVVFSQRVVKLRAALDACKELRATVLSCTKPGTVIDCKKLAEDVKVIQTNFHGISLEDPKPWVAFPLVWVQA